MRNLSSVTDCCGNAHGEVDGKKSVCESDVAQRLWAFLNMSAFFE